MQIGQGESLVQFFVSGFANSPKSGRSSGEKRTGRFIANGLSQTLYLQKWPKSVFEIVVRAGRKKNTLVESY